MSLLNDVSDIPTVGQNLIIVAAVNKVLHFRIFDDDGKVVVDTDEKRLTEQARQIEDLRKQLESLWPPHELTRSDKDRVITAVTSIVGHTPEKSVDKRIRYLRRAIKQFTRTIGFALDTAIRADALYRTAAAYAELVQCEAASAATWRAYGLDALRRAEAADRRDEYATRIKQLRQTLG